jgi:uncharacterized LabA/DUF88 family protein
MVLNISPKRREDPPATEATAAEVAPPAEEIPAEEPRKRTRRPSTRTRAAAAPAASAAEAVEAAETVAVEVPESVPAPAPRTRTRRGSARKPAEAPAPEPAVEDLVAALTEEVLPAVEVSAEAEAEADAVDLEPETTGLAEGMVEAVGDDPHLEEIASDAAAADSRRRRSRGGRGRGRGRERGEERPDTAEAPAVEDDQAEPAIARDDASTPRELRPVLRALEQQSKQMDRLARMTEDLARRVDKPAGTTGGAPVKTSRVGVFVDTANIELATDRLRVRFDWGKVLRLLLKDRQLVRAVAYSPIHDDPAVSIETQRFVEPFLDRGFKIVTKPFRRFQDGSIKANLDIELALDVVAMLDRLDVLVLVSGDGDFQRLVELAQSRGVRVEVAAVGASTASNLRHSADEYVDLGTRARDIRVER